MIRNIMATTIFFFFFFFFFSLFEFLTTNNSFRVQFGIFLLEAFCAGKLAGNLAFFSLN